MGLSEPAFFISVGHLSEGNSRSLAQTRPSYDRRPSQQGLTIHGMDPLDETWDTRIGSGTIKAGELSEVAPGAVRLWVRAGLEST